MYTIKAREAIKKILKDCATPGTIWNRHMEADDAIDVWRETNVCLLKCGEPPIIFDAFYVALQQFGVECKQGFEIAVDAFIARVESDLAPGSHKKSVPPRGRKVA